MGLDDEVEQEYDERFDEKQRTLLSGWGVPPEMANRYDERFRGIDVVAIYSILPESDKSTVELSLGPKGTFKKLDLKPAEDSPAYDSTLRQTDLSPEAANAFDSRFSGREISEMLTWSLKVAREKKNDGPYPSRTLEKTIESKINQQSVITAGIANRYDSRFNGSDIIMLVNGEVPPIEAARYNPRFKGWEIMHLHRVRVSPEIADTYRAGFNGTEIAYLVEAGISPSLAEEYNKLCPPHEGRESQGLLTGIDICYAFKMGLSPEQLWKYDTRFSREERRAFLKDKIRPETASSYPSWLKGEEIVELVKKGCPPGQAQHYKQRTRDGPETTKQLILKINDEPVKQRTVVYPLYDESGAQRWLPYTIGEQAQTPIAKLHEIGWTPDIANRYDDRFNYYEVFLLLNEHVAPEHAHAFEKRFDGTHIIQLNKWGIEPETVNEFPAGFTGDQILKLCALHTSSKTAKRYSASLDPEEICAICSAGLTPEMIISPEGKIRELILKMARFISTQDSFNLLGTGAKGIVLLQGDRAWKFSEQISREFSLLNDVYSANKGSLRNVIKVRGEPIENFALEIEYIDGDTLEERVKRGIIPKEDALRYTSGILNGIAEMRAGGVMRHRDLRPANILIDSMTDRPVIIDLGIATTDENALPKDNRRYGGPNDLTSVGQIWFYILTQKHVFDDSNSMSKTFGSVAEQINDARTKAYEDETGKMIEPYLRKVDEEVPDEQARELIKKFLLANNGDLYQLMKECRPAIPHTATLLDKLKGIFKK